MTLMRWLDKQANNICDVIVFLFFLENFLLVILTNL